MAKRETTNKAEKEVKKEEITQSNVVLFTTTGEEADLKKYFYQPEGEELNIPPFIKKVVGVPVNREDLIEVFHEIFKPEDEFLFYKSIDSEVYLVIPTLEYADIGAKFGSVNGDFQRHAISFINEGSVNLETLRQRLQMIAKSLNYSKK